MPVAATWPLDHDNCEMALVARPDAEARVLIVPALLGEANKMRRFAVDTMRALAENGVGSILPDLPGTNESLAPLASQTIAGWRKAMDLAARHYEATHAVGMRGGCLCLPGGLPALSLSPVSGVTIVRAMLRMHQISEREAGRETTREALEARARQSGLRIGGYELTPQLYRDLVNAEPPPVTEQLPADTLGGPGVWLRAEPSSAVEQSRQFARAITEWVV